MAAIPDIGGSTVSIPPPWSGGQEEVGRGAGATEKAQLMEGFTSGPSQWLKGSQGEGAG